MGVGWGGAQGLWLSFFSLHASILGLWCHSLSRVFLGGGRVGLGASRVSEKSGEKKDSLTSLLSVRKCGKSLGEGV